ncbi:MAG: response regulator transcription factor [Sulfuricurvum sp.]|jgi:OmpR-family two-component system manganese-sensing response regulator|uniref:response regulator transcription factor n=1 Tax=Sulfuricurvum sp. TaxID=2025608 RepID=UPI0025D95423|nr:response regulator transcription factor [Sulfuricurvum sp.]MCK9371828.1 response regulator transcription factor [Sulfuricurvum sp.]
MPKNKASYAVRILLLEDDPTLSDIIDEFLSEQGCEVTCVYDGEAALDAGYEKSFDLFLFDVKVPYTNGFDVLRTLREDNKQAPAIFMTSLGSIEDLSAAYDAGCDDYLKKPFELKELELRIKALIKRSPGLNLYEPIVITEDLLFDFKQGRLIHEGIEIPLARKEAKILKMLLSHPNEIISTQILIESAWDFHEEATEESLRTHIKNLRKHLGKETILNIRGQGYSIART